MAFCISFLKLKLETFSLFFPSKLCIFYHSFFFFFFTCRVIFSLNFIEPNRKASLTDVSLSSIFSVILFTVNISYYRKVRERKRGILYFSLLVV